MDLGVGSFIFAQGVASALPLIKEPDHLSKRIWPKILTSMKKTSPLLLLALTRLLLVKGTDYPGVRTPISYSMYRPKSSLNRIMLQNMGRIGISSLLSP
jgi:hypothetical protein